MRRTPKCILFIDATSGSWVAYTQFINYREEIRVILCAELSKIHPGDEWMHVYLLSRLVDHINKIFCTITLVQTSSIHVTWLYSPQLICCRCANVIRTCIDMFGSWLYLSRHRQPPRLPAANVVLLSSWRWNMMLATLWGVWDPSFCDFCLLFDLILCRLSWWLF